MKALTPRFEIHSCRTGYLEAVHGDIASAMRYADELRREFGESFCIVDAELPAFGFDGSPDDRIVWRHGELRESARRWLLKMNAMNRARRWEEVRP